MEELYKISSRNNEEWGIEGYQIEKKYFDYNRAIKQREYEAVRNSGSPGKQPKIHVTKRGNFLDDSIKMTKTPGPGNYNIDLAWINKADTERGKKRSKNTKRNTFIDSIFTEQKIRPMPGPGAHNL